MSDKKRLVGAEMPDQIHDYIKLMACYLGTSKSSVLRSALSEWKENHEMDTKDLTDSIKNGIQLEWNKIKQLTSKGEYSESWSSFMDDKKKELSRAGLDDKLITQIINKVTQ